MYPTAAQIAAALDAARRVEEIMASAEDAVAAADRMGVFTAAAEVQPGGWARSGMRWRRPTGWASSWAAVEDATRDAARRVGEIGDAVAAADRMGEFVAAVEDATRDAARRVGEIGDAVAAADRMGEFVADVGTRIAAIDDVVAAASHVDEITAMIKQAMTTSTQPVNFLIGASRQSSMTPDDSTRVDTSITPTPTREEVRIRFGGYAYLKAWGMILQVVTNPSTSRQLRPIFKTSITIAIIGGMFASDMQAESLWMFDILNPPA